jgi:hypothetical protein
MVKSDTIECTCNPSEAVPYLGRDQPRVISDTFHSGNAIVQRHGQSRNWSGGCNPAWLVTDRRTDSFGRSAWPGLQTRKTNPQGSTLSVPALLRLTRHAKALCVQGVLLVLGTRSCAFSTGDFGLRQGSDSDSNGTGAATGDDNGRGLSGRPSHLGSRHSKDRRKATEKRQQCRGYYGSESPWTPCKPSSLTLKGSHNLQPPPNPSYIVSERTCSRSAAQTINGEETGSLVLAPSRGQAELLCLQLREVWKQPGNTRKT